MYRQSEKNLLSSNVSSTCPHNMVNFSQLAAEIVSLVWGTPGNFNVFRVLAALLHGTLVVGVSQTAALNRGRHLYSAERASRWALAHISSCSANLLNIIMLKFPCAVGESEIRGSDFHQMSPLCVDLNLMRLELTMGLWLEQNGI